MNENISNNYQQPQHEQEPKELLWPPNGYVFEQESLLPAYCKPKICPLKSVTLEKLEKMQEEANRRMRELEEKERKENGENDEGNNVCLELKIKKNLVIIWLTLLFSLFP
ncbi:unnamed protein product [Meloidogyne enterolobii]|uniref:Uncharacterized protein n=1 Tax=Meloidogyne enterolobii TaxID=390850 RepID=A0ACB0XKU8_MELEN